MSFCIRPSVCKKCGKPLTMFEGWTCLECEKAEQDIPTMYYPQVEGITPTVVKSEPCTDAVSRQAVLDELDDTNRRGGFGCKLSYTRCRGHIEQLPSVKPQEPKMGHWIEIDSDDPCWYMCSECHRQSDIKENYCPSCGADMRGDADGRD